MNKHLISFLLALTLIQTPAPLLAGGYPPPPLMLANNFRADIRLADYWVSEKFDDVRGYWDGEKLLARGGEPIHAPQWFTAGWPNVPLDGELWVGHGRFSRAVSTVRQSQPDDAAWREVRFMLFDLPGHPGDFSARDVELGRIVAAIGQTWAQHVGQFEVNGPAELQAVLARVVRQGGEGLMLHRGASHYRAERDDDLLKLKPFQDAEARVVGHLPGKGKYAGMLGALEIETAEGLRFRLGSGRGCKNFCVNGHLAGNCLTLKGSEHDRSTKSTIA